MLDDTRRRLVMDAFRMPSFQSMVSRKSSITNAFVTAIIPVIPPQAEEIDEALTVLRLNPAELRCAYCGDLSTEWDHLRPLVVKRRPTGFISEIANLVPACGKCNQSKGNKDWREWMLGGAKRSPTGRELGGIDVRVGRLEEFVRWRTPTVISFRDIVGDDEWERYWSLCESVVQELRCAQVVADGLRSRVAAHLSQG